LIMPSMDHRVAVEVVDEFENALLELVLGGDADVTEYGAGGFGKEALDEVEPRSVLGGEDELEAPFGSGREPSLGFSRNMRGVIVDNDLDRGCRGVSHVEDTKEFDELATAMAISDQGMDLPGEQVDARHQGDCSVPLVLVIASDRRMSSGNRRQIGSHRADRLDAWFLVVRDDRDRRFARASRIRRAATMASPNTMTASYHISNKSQHHKHNILIVWNISTSLGPTRLLAMMCR
jgi:hypothetical protein